MTLPLNATVQNATPLPENAFREDRLFARCDVIGP